jgi:hypothetical protein
MTGSQIFVLILLLGGAVAFGIFFAGLGLYYKGKNSDKNSKQ